MMSASVSVFVCLSESIYLQYYITDLHQLLCTLPVTVVWFSSSDVAMLCNFCISGFTDDVMFAHNGPYGGMSISLQRVISLRRRAQVNAAAVSYCLRILMHSVLDVGRS